MDVFDVDPIEALFWSAVLNCRLAPFRLIALFVVATDKRIMQDQPSSLTTRGVVGVTTVVMFGAAVAMFVF